MPDRGPHCPFLNKSDDRCSKHFHVDKLDYAFEHCFDKFASCSIYLERLVERRMRRNVSVLHESDIERGATHATHDAIEDGPLVQITIPRRFRQPAAAVEAVPHVSGF